MKTYRAEALYVGDDRSRSQYTENVFKAASDDSAIRFTHFIFNDWDHSKVAVWRHRMTEVPGQYEQGQRLETTSANYLVEEWVQ